MYLARLSKKLSTNSITKIENGMNNGNLNGYNGVTTLTTCTNTNGSLLTQNNTQHQQQCNGGVTTNTSNLLRNHQPQQQQQIQQRSMKLETSSISMSIKSIDNLLDEGSYTGNLNLSSKKLKEFPAKNAQNYDLSDTINVDMSHNELQEFPKDVCSYIALETMTFYANNIRSIPDCVIKLRCLRLLDLSQNCLSYLPPSICKLQMLEVLIVNNNRLVSLPEEIYELRKLIQLDVSCNEITHLPIQIGDMKSLRALNVRKNYLVELPNELSKCKLISFDCSSNRITKLPLSLKEMMMTLVELNVDNNPLQMPPASLCTKGLLHIMKYLLNETVKEEKKRGILSEYEINTRNGEHRGSLAYQSSRNLLINRPSSQLLANLTTPNKQEELTKSQKHSSNLQFSQPQQQQENVKQLVNGNTRHQSITSVPASNLKTQNDNKFVYSSSLANTNNNNNNSYLNVIDNNRLLTQSITTRQQQVVSNHTYENNPFSVVNHENTQSRNIDIRLITVQQNGKSQELVKQTTTTIIATNDRNGHDTSSSSSTSDDYKLVELLRHCVEKRLRIKLNDTNVGQSLADGVILCHLVNQIFNKPIEYIHTPTLALPQLSNVKCRKNVENFTNTCRSLGLSDHEICPAQDILESRNTHFLARTVLTLLNMSQINVNITQQQQQQSQPQQIKLVEQQTAV